jgi:hypothetical protein
LIERLLSTIYSHKFEIPKTDTVHTLSKNETTSTKTFDFTKIIPKTKMCKATPPTKEPQKVVTVTKSTRRVRFGHATKKLFHQPLSQSDKSAIWYCGREYKAMNKEVHYTLKHELYYGVDPYDAERSWRGLEHIREGVPNAKLQRRRYYVRTFLHLHKQLGVTDPQELGAFATEFTDEDQIRAEQFGQYDAYEASTVYYEQTNKEQAQECYKEFSDIPRAANCIEPKRRVIVATSAA